MKKSVKATIICMLVVAILNAFVFSAQAAATGYTDDTYVTPYGATVDISRWDGYTISETYFSMSHYPSATLVATGDYAYNCFTYAMIYDGNIDCASQLSSDQKFCIEDAEDLLGSGNVCFNRISFDEIQAGDLVFYKWPEINNGTSDFYAGMAHVAIVTQPAATVQDTYVVSKWGVWDVYSHKITECPYSNAGGGSLTVTSTGNNGAILNVELSFYSVNHTYQYTPVMMTAPLPTITTTSLYHFVECESCGAFHYEVHTYVGTNTTCSDCGYVSNIELNQIDNEVTQ